jgi:hypothetical protein
MNETKRAIPILGKVDRLFGCMIHCNVLKKAFSTKEEMGALNPLDSICFQISDSIAPRESMNETIQVIISIVMQGTSLISLACS